MNREMQRLSFEQLSLVSTLDLLDLMWRRKFVMGVTTASAILIGLLYYVQADRTYESSADVLLVQKRPEVVTGDQRYVSSFEDYIVTHLALIVSPLIVERAIENSDLRSLKTFDWVDPEQYSLAEVIGDQLAVTGGSRDLGDNADRIVTLSFEGTEPEECPLVVEAVLNAYMTFLGEIYEGMSDDTMNLIEQARGILQNDLQTQEEAYVQFRQDSPLIARGTQEVNPLQDRLATIETQRSALLIRRADIEGQLRTIRNARQSGYDQERLRALVTDLRNRDSTVDVQANLPTALDNQLLQLFDQEKQLLQHFGPNHPHVENLRQRISATRQLLALPSTAYMQDPEDMPRPSSVNMAKNFVDLYEQYLQQALEHIEISEDLLTQLYQREHVVAKELSGFQLRDETFRRNIDRTQQLYDGIISQLQEASLVKQYGGFEARVIASPLEGEKVSPAARIVLPVAAFSGLALGFLIAIVAEMKDTSFRSSRDIQSRLGLPVIGQIPQIAAAGKGLTGTTPYDRNLCTHLDPESPSAEAIRGLRTSLLFNHRYQTCRVLQLTGPSPDDGTSTIAANLAISIAQLGRHVLLIDADLHRPRQEQLLGMTVGAEGPATLAAGENILSAVTRSPFDNLWLLPADPLRAAGAEFFASTQFAELLAASKKQFDMVLIDTEPLLAVSDARVIASQVDGVLIALWPTKDSRWRAERAKELLDAIDVTPIGIVVNGLGAPSSKSYHDDLDATDHNYTDSHRTDMQPNKALLP